MKLTDDQWDILEPLLPGKVGGGGRPAHDNRKFFDAILWVSSGSNRWSNFPVEFGSRQNHYMRFRRWNESQFWRQLATELKGDPDLTVLLEKIIAYSDQEAQKTELRAMRRANRPLLTRDRKRWFRKFGQLVKL
jgi:transposase